MSLISLMQACAKRAANDSIASPEAAEADDLSGLEQQLAQREDQLRSVGVEPPAASRDVNTAGYAAAAGASADATSPPAEPTSPAAEQRADAKPKDSGDRCQQVCEISAAICELEQQICGLLPRHRGDDRYQAACDRSAADCRVSTEACNACTAN